MRVVIKWSTSEPLQTRDECCIREAKSSKALALECGAQEVSLFPGSDDVAVCEDCKAWL